MAVDDADNIYIADYGGIIKLNKDLNEIDTERDIERDTSLQGVSVVGDEVMVCNNKNGCILVYTKELKYVRQIKDPVHFKGIYISR